MKLAKPIPFTITIILVILVIIIRYKVLENIQKNPSFFLV